MDAVCRPKFADQCIGLTTVCSPFLEPASEVSPPSAGTLDVLWGASDVLDSAASWIFWGMRRRLLDLRTVDIVWRTRSCKRRVKRCEIDCRVTVGSHAFYTQLGAVLPSALSAQYRLSIG